MERKICVIAFQTGNITKMPRVLAEGLVEQKTHAFTTKAKLKSFLNQEGKLHRNKRITDKMTLDARNTISGVGNKNYAICPTKMPNHKAVTGQMLRIIHY